jgi:hypothetical protein
MHGEVLYIMNNYGVAAVSPLWIDGAVRVHHVYEA